MKKVCIGGTFDRLHKGHNSLIEKALKVADEDGYLFIGLTKKKITENNEILECFEKRKKNLKKLLENKKTSTIIEIKPIYDKYGPAIDTDFDAIVVSSETKKTALEINKRRFEDNKKLLDIIVVPFVLAEDKKPISSTRIRKNEINQEGKKL